jgi:hypothetical protein
MPAEVLYAIDAVYEQLKPEIALRRRYVRRIRKIVPITWTISHAERLVVARAEGPISLRDIEALLDDVVIKEAIGYRKLFDARGSVGTYSDEDVMALGARIQAYVRLNLSGAAAIVVDSQKQFNVALRFANIAKAKRPIQVFYSPEEARAWLDSDPGSEDTVI